MIILKSNGGQLCNKIWSYASIITYSLKYNTTVYILDFDEYVTFFEDLKFLPHVHFVTNSLFKKAIRFFYKYYSYLFPYKSFSYSENNTGVFMCNGWDFRSQIEILKENKDCVIKLFSPKDELINSILDCIIRLKQKKTIVGVHIRRGDYKTHLNGMYFFDDLFYQKRMFELNDVLKVHSSREIVFLICSDEVIDIHLFAGLECFQMENAIQVQDLFSLSQCDYIIGPPSTFSMWASFVGQVPLLILSSKHQIVELNQFKIIAAVDRFEDGTSFEHSFVV